MTDLPRNDQFVIWKAGTSRAREVERTEADRLNTQNETEPSGQSTTCTLPSGIVAWYRAEDNAGDAIGDNHGTAFATTYGPGLVGRAFQFDGEAYVRVPNAPSLNSATVSRVAVNIIRCGWPSSKSSS
jgi:hypothetical protein